MSTENQSEHIDETAAQDTSSPAPEENLISPEAASPESDVLSGLAASGLDTSRFESEADVANYINQLEKDRQELETYAQVGRQYMPYAQDFNNYLQQQQAQQAQPEKEESAEQSIDDLRNQLWGKPEYDPSWEQMVQENPHTGQIEGISPYVPANVVQGVQNYRSWQRQAVQKFLDDPFTLMQQGLEPYFEKKFAEMIDGRFSQQQQDAEMQRVEADLANTIYAVDETGNYKVDPVTNTYQLNEYGQMLVPEMQKLQAAGVTDPVQLKALAESNLKALAYDYQQQQAQQPAAEAAPPEQAVAPATVPPPSSSKQESFLQKARQASRSPNMGGRLNSPETPASETTIQNDDFFESIARSQGHLR